MSNQTHLLSLDFINRIIGIACFALFVSAIYKVTGKSSDIGYISLVTIGPAFLLTVFSGKLVGKLSSLGTLRVVLALRLLLFIGATFLAKDAVTLLFSAAVQSLLHQASVSSKMALDAEMLLAEQRRIYNARKTMLANVAVVAGPALGGTLVAMLSVQMALAIMAVISGCGLILALTFKAPNHFAKSAISNLEYGPSALSSIRHLFDNRATASIVGVYCTVSMILEVQAPILFPFVKEVYARTSSFTGTLLGLAGFGGIVGALMAQKFPNYLQESLIPWLVIADGVLFLIFTHLTEPVVAAVLFTTLGLMGSITLVVVETAIQRDVENVHRPFVFSLMQFSGGAGGATLGIIAAFLVDDFGARPVLSAAALVEIFVGFIMVTISLVLSTRFAKRAQE